MRDVEESTDSRPESLDATLYLRLSLISDAPPKYVRPKLMPPTPPTPSAMTLIVENMAFSLPFVDLNGQPADEFGRAYLNGLRWNRLRVQMSRWLRQQSEPPTAAAFQAELARRDAAFVFDGAASEDELETEALNIAEEHLRSLLAIDGFPAPKNLREHAQHLILSDASFRDRAVRRLEARSSAAAELARNLLTAHVESGASA
jgi:hypothetical protein